MATLADSSGLLTILSPFGIIVGIGLILIAVKCGKKAMNKYQKVKDIVYRVKNILFFTVILRVIINGFLPVVVSSGLGNNLSYDESTTKANLYQIVYLAFVTYMAFFFVIFID